VTTPVGHVDLLPTLVNLAGGAGERWMAGRSLLPELAGTPDRDRDVFQEVSYEGPVERRALVTRRWHLIHNQVPDNTFELYDLENDPGLTRDLWGIAEGEALRQRLVAWTESMRFAPESAEKLARATWRDEKPQVALDARFGDQLVLHGVDMTPHDLEPGEQIALRWYLECLRPIEPGWKLFVHAEGPGGARFLGDHDPVEGLMPLARLRPGQRIIDRHWLAIPAHTPPGEYTIWIGAFKGSKRLRVAGTTDDRVRAGTIRVIR
jgi:hypothetical protein